VDRADAHGLAEGLRRPEQPEAVAACGRVDHDEVVGGVLAATALKLRELPDLPDRRQLARTRGGRREVVEDPVAEHQAGEALRSELVLQVLLQRALRVDRDRVQVVGQLGLLGADALAVKGARDALLARDLADDRPLARPRRGQSQGSRDRRLSDASFAGDEDQPLVEECGHAGRILPQAYE
jgi:hypothetical protein